MDYLDSDTFMEFVLRYMPREGVDFEAVLAALAIFSSLSLFQSLTGVPIDIGFILAEIFTRLNMQDVDIPNELLNPAFLHYIPYMIIRIFIISHYTVPGIELNLALALFVDGPVQILDFFITFFRLLPQHFEDLSLAQVYGLVINTFIDLGQQLNQDWNIEPGINPDETQRVHILQQIIRRILHNLGRVIPLRDLPNIFAFVLFHLFLTILGIDLNEYSIEDEDSDNDRPDSDSDSCN